MLLKDNKLDSFLLFHDHEGISVVYSSRMSALPEDHNFDILWLTSSTKGSFTVCEIYSKRHSKAFYFLARNLALILGYHVPKV